MSNQFTTTPASNNRSYRPRRISVTSTLPMPFHWCQRISRTNPYDLTSHSRRERGESTVGGLLGLETCGHPALIPRNKYRLSDNTTAANLSRARVPESECVRAPLQPECRRTPANNGTGGEHLLRSGFCPSCYRISLLVS